MLGKLQARLTYANVMATLALFIALGGGAYAVSLGRNDIKSRHIATGQVKSVDVANDSGGGALKAGDIADLHTSGRKPVNDPSGDSSSTPAELFRSGGVTVDGRCRDNDPAVGGKDIANVHVGGEKTAISLIEANGATEASAPGGSVATLSVSVSHSSDLNVLNSAYFVAVEPNGNVVSGSVSAEVNDTQDGFDCIFAATGIG